MYLATWESGKVPTNATTTLAKFLPKVNEFHVAPVIRQVGGNFAKYYPTNQLETARLPFQL